MTMTTLHKVVNEGQDYTFDVTPDTDTTGQTIEVYLYDEDGNEDKVGSTSGVAKGNTATFVLSIGDKQVGEYIMEVWADLGGNDPELLFPNEGQRFKLIIQDREAV